MVITFIRTDRISNYEAALRFCNKANYEQTLLNFCSKSDEDLDTGLTTYYLSKNFDLMGLLWTNLKQFKIFGAPLAPDNIL